MDNIKINSYLMVFFILTLITVGQTSINIYISSLPTMASALHTQDDLVKMTVGIFLLGFACSQLIYGPISDFFGRRPVLLIGLFISTLGSILCAISHSIEWLLFARLLEGLGIGAASVMSRAIMRDIFNGKDLLRITSYASIAWTVIPLTAPIIGSYIQSYLQWRINFVLLAACSIILFLSAFYFLPETKGKNKFASFDLSRILKNYKTIITDRIFLWNVFIVLIIYGIIISFSIISPFLLQVNLKLSPIHYSWALFIVTLGFFSGSFLNSRMIKFYTPNQLILCGFIVLLFSNILMLGLAFVGMLNLLDIIIPMCLVFFSIGLIYPNCAAGCLSLFPEIAGSVSALYGFFVFLGGSLASITAAQLSAKTQIPLSVTMLIGSLLGFGIFVKMVLTKDSSIPLVVE